MAFAALLTTAAVTAAPGSAAFPPLHGLALVANGPAKQGLLTLDPTTGNAKVIGPAHAELFGEGDLVTVVHDRLYYLGDTTRGATLVALNLTDGSEICSAPVSFREISYVGIGQSLDYDKHSDTLVLSGVAESKNASHAVYRASATGCGPFKLVGTFGSADYLPMLHASSFDAEGQRLFVIVGTGQSSSAVAVVDLTKPSGTKLTLIAEGPSPDSTLLCMHWDSKTKRLVGVVGVTAGALQLNILDPSASKWETPKQIQNVPSGWDQLGGNQATVSAFDVASGSLILMAGHADPATGDAKYELATIDVEVPKVLSHPKLVSVGMPGCMDCVTALTF